MKIRKITYSALLGALAAGLSAIEVLFVPFMPFGAKPGLSNVVTMYAAKSLGIGSALAITLIKSLFVLVMRGTVAALMSLAGGTVSALATAFLLKNGKTKMGYIGIGIIGALLHNFSQLGLSFAIIGAASLYYLPSIIFFAVVNGTLTGLILFATIGFLRKKDGRIQ